MVSDVEVILNEIRERVIAEQPASESVDTMAQPVASTNGSSATATDQNESLSRLSAHLSVTGRAWDRLPPVVSNRHGAAARFELWIKNTFKSLMRWFTWEQVNYNAAVHHALVDARDPLRVHGAQLAAVTNESATSNEKLETVDLHVKALHSQLEILSTDLRNQAADRADVSSRLEKIEVSLGHFSKMLSELAEEMRASHSQVANDLNNKVGVVIEEMTRRLAELSADLHEEQRVCFKQLSLEASEAAVLEDRGRRALAERVQKLEQASRNSG